MIFALTEDSEGTKAAARVGPNVRLDDVVLIGLKSKIEPRALIDRERDNWADVERDVKTHYASEQAAILVFVSYRIKGFLKSSEEDESSENEATRTTSSDSATEPGEGGAESPDSDISIFNIQANWLLQYAVHNDEKIDPDDVVSFGEISGAFAAHPYMRELAQSLTLRMGLPPLVLDVVRSPLFDDSHAGNGT